MNRNGHSVRAVRVGAPLTLADLIAVTRDNAHVELDPEARELMGSSRAWVDRIVAENTTPVYGVNTGFGVFANVRISPDQTRDLMRRLILSHAAGVGDPLPEEAVRAALLVRAQTLAQGYSGVRVEVVQCLLDMLNRCVHPIIPCKGSVGASGDLAPLSHLALVLSTDSSDNEAESGEAHYNGERMSGKQAMAKAGIRRLVLEAKEGLALNNGTSISAGLDALSVWDAANLVENAQLALALTLEAIRGISAAFDSRLHRAGRHRGQELVAARIRALTHGSRLLDSTDRIQDPYSIRCGPQVIGAARDSVEYASRIIEEEINAATDNPLIFVEANGEGESRSGGNFHGESLAFASSIISLAASELGAQSERRIYRLCDAKLNDGLPMMLVGDGGLNSGLMMAQVTAAALASDNKTLSHPDVLDSIPTSAGQEDHVPMAANAARHTREVIWNVERIIAIELMAAAQAIDLRLERLNMKPDGLGEGTRDAFSRIRERVPVITRDRILHTDIASLVEMVHSGSLVMPTLKPEPG